MAANHRTLALDLLATAADIVQKADKQYDSTIPADRVLALHTAGISAGIAAAHAQIYLGDQMRALVEQQRAANALEALSHPGVVESLDEHRAARAKARRLLDLSTPEGGQFE